ncbi:hypothetical protein ACSBL2_22925 [Pedobacter sp. AW31-3R]|uniref:hypothetical protein n=1 Tax=Pedobacter sp. AW31-3R TaxID=3445781 RepID=UPI003FA0B216
MKFKILIIDDKDHSVSESSTKLISKLEESHRKFLTLRADIEGLWGANEQGDDVILLHDFRQYEYVFIHDSFNEPLILASLKESFINQVSFQTQLVFFSGSRSRSRTPKQERLRNINPDVSYYAINRSQYFENMNNFLDSAILGRQDIIHLYDKSNPIRSVVQEELKKAIMVDLEESIEKAARGVNMEKLLEFLKITDISGYVETFAKKDDIDFIRSLDML